MPELEDVDMNGGLGGEDSSDDDDSEVEMEGEEDKEKREMADAEDALGDLF
jgi:hypothetical protein